MNIKDKVDKRKTIIEESFAKNQNTILELKNSINEIAKQIEEITDIQKKLMGAYEVLLSFDDDFDEAKEDEVKENEAKEDKKDKK